MLGTNNYTAFVIGTVLTAIVPGANTYRVLEGAYQRGLKGGVAASAGVVTADIVFMAAAAVGLGALVRIHPGLFIALLLGGAAYFAKLGWGILTTRIQVRAAENTSDAHVLGSVPSAGKIAKDAFLTCIANFKAIFFYGLFLPGFIDAGYTRPWVPLLVLCLTCLAVLIVYYTALCLIGVRLFTSEFGLRFFRYATVVFGVFVLILAAGMAYEAVVMVMQRGS